MTKCALTLMLLICSFSTWADFSHFITREGSVLYDGSDEFRFAGIHAPELHRIEDDARGKCIADDRGWGQFFKWPTPDEQENWFASLNANGHKAMRIYVLSVAHPSDKACGRQTHVLAPTQYDDMPSLNEEAMIVYDRMIALASKHQIRLILPFIDHWSWWGGKKELADFYKENENALYDTTSKTYRAYQHIIQQVINRKNTITGRHYYQEKAIMAWETGNELKASTPEFVAKTAALIKSLAPQHLVVDGNYLSILSSSLEDPNVDIISNHFYSVNGNNKPQTIIDNLSAIEGKKAYIVGEFGLLPIKEMTQIMDTVVDAQVDGHKASGAFIWGMRGRRHDGGFYWHYEGDSGYTSYHLPGFAEGDDNEELAVISLVRRSQARMNGLDNPEPLAIPTPPTLRPIFQNRKINWLGSPTGRTYRIERRKGDNSSWEVIAQDITDGIKDYDPAHDALFIDKSTLEAGVTYHYRVIAKNESGESAPSNSQSITIVEAAPDRFVSVVDGQFYRYGTPYYFTGTNYWYGPLLGATDAGKQRLTQELDQLKQYGITNLRVLVGAEGSVGNAVIKPALQPEQGKYNADLLKGLDVLIAEMDKRDMIAVLYMNNNWIWSGGYSQYLSWNGYGPVPNPFDAENEWQDYMDYAAQYYSCLACIEAYHDHVKFIMGRTNTVSGKNYKDDATIMSWQLANEPRIFIPENKEAYRHWLHTSATLISDLAPNQLVSTGSEGAAGSLNSPTLFAQMHQHPAIDYLTMHAWPKNWSWFDPKKPEASLAVSIEKARDYIATHNEFAILLNKPIVLSEFGFPRDNESLSPDSSVIYRNRFYQAILDTLLESKNANKVFAGINFWAFGGMGVANSDGDGIWQARDDYLGDPAQEPQGLNTVFSTDVSTLKLVEQMSKQLR